MIIRVSELDDKVMAVYSQGVASGFTKESLDREYCPVDLG